MKPLPLLMTAGLFSLATSLPAIETNSYERVWRDDFDSEKLNPDYWTYDAGVGVWNTEANKELQYYTDRPQNVRVEDGVLVLEAHRESFDSDRLYSFTSARVKTSGRMNFQYGILKARLRITDLANGLWPAFWTLGDVADGWPQSGEIDIMEAGHYSLINSGLVNKAALGVVHWCYQPEPVDNPWEFHSYYPSPFSTPPLNPIYSTVESLQDWHVWTLVWTDSVIQMYIDDAVEPYFNFNYDPEVLFEFTNPQALIFNLAIGGSFTQIPSPSGVTAPFPARMEVDYVELWQQPGVGEFYSAAAAGTRLEGKVAVGVLAEGTDGLEFSKRIPIDDDFGSIYSWNNLTIAEGTSPNEGTNSLSFTVPDPGQWFGGGIQTLSNFLNFEKFVGGYVVFDMKTSTTAPFRLGIGCLTTGNGEVTFLANEEKWGLKRDGQWHTVRIPVGAFGENVDLATINTLFYVVNDAPGTAVQMEVDNLYWEEADDQPTPENGNFAIFSETPENATAGTLAFDVDSHLFLWENSLIDGPATMASEGNTAWSFKSAPGFNWWGAGIFCFKPLNLTAFENGSFHFDLKTTYANPFRVGMKSDLHGKVGQLWIDFEGAGKDPYGFVRDGNWHSIEIPVQELLEMSNLNLYEIVQVFEILSTSGAISNLAIDNIYFSGGTTAKTDRWGSEEPTGVTFADIFPEAITVDDLSLTWMGYIYDEFYPWVFHYGNGWLYLPPFPTSFGTWAFDLQSGYWNFWLKAANGTWVYVYDENPSWREVGN